MSVVFLTIAFSCAYCSRNVKMLSPSTSATHAAPKSSSGWSRLRDNPMATASSYSVASTYSSGSDNHRESGFIRSRAAVSRRGYQIPIISAASCRASIRDGRAQSRPKANSWSCRRRREESHYSATNRRSETPHVVPYNIWSHELALIPPSVIAAAVAQGPHSCHLRVRELNVNQR